MTYTRTALYALRMRTRQHNLQSSSGATALTNSRALAELCTEELCICSRLPLVLLSRSQPLTSLSLVRCAVGLAQGRTRASEQRRARKDRGWIAGRRRSAACYRRRVQSDVH